jgi:hypothetical protein
MTNFPTLCKQSTCNDRMNYPEEITSYFRTIGLKDLNRRQTNGQRNNKMANESGLNNFNR